MTRITLCTAATTAAAAPAGDPRAGKVAYQKHCQMCHGPEGQGNPAPARPLTSREVQAWPVTCAGRATAGSGARPAWQSCAVTPATGGPGRVLTVKFFTGTAHVSPT